MKKPWVQVLLQGHSHSTPTDGTGTKVSIVDASGEPKMFLSHQVFQTIVADHSLKAIDFMLHQYQVQPFEALRNVTITSSSEHQLSTVNQIGCKVQTRLQFGSRLIHSPRRRKRKPESKPQGDERSADKLPSKKSKHSHSVSASAAAAANPVPANLEGIAKELENLHQSVSTSAAKKAEPAESPESSSDVSSTSTSSDETGSLCEDGGSTSDSDAAEAAEVPFLGPEAKEEEREIQVVLASHSRLMQLRHGQFVGQKGLEEDGGSEVQSGPLQDCEQAAASTAAPAAVHVPQGKSFCNRIIGFVDSGIQVSRKLATCRECNIKIPYKGVRFAYAWSKTKFHGWIHAKCVLQHLDSQHGCVRQALHFLEAERAKPELQAEVKTEIETLVGELRPKIARLEQSRWST